MKKAIIFSLLALFATTTYAFSQDLQFIECSLKPIPHSAVHHGGQKKAPHQKSSETASTNWSGYAAETKFNRPEEGSVTYVSGTWTVPVLSPTLTDAYSSIWVGIDGYTSNSVEQLGTEHDWSNGVQSNYAWFEMYPQDAYEITGFPVDIGDVMRASVTYNGNNKFTLSISNLTQNVYTTIPSKYTKVAGTKRTSAEWIVEAPFAGEVLPLADFGTVYFTDCLATINGVKGGINNSHWQNVEILMESASGQLRAVPSSLFSNGESFSVKWLSE